MRAHKILAAYIWYKAARRILARRQHRARRDRCLFGDPTAARKGPRAAHHVHRHRHVRGFNAAAVHDQRLHLDRLPLLDEQTVGFQAYVQRRRMNEQRRRSRHRLSVDVADRRFDGHAHRPRRSQALEMHAEAVHACGVRRRGPGVRVAAAVTAAVASVAALVSRAPPRCPNPEAPRVPTGRHEAGRLRAHGPVHRRGGQGAACVVARAGGDHRVFTERPRPVAHIGADLELRATELLNVDRAVAVVVGPSAPGFDHQRGAAQVGGLGEVHLHLKTAGVSELAPPFGERVPERRSQRPLHRADRGLGQGHRAAVGDAHPAFPMHRLARSVQAAVAGEVPAQPVLPDAAVPSAPPRRILGCRHKRRVCAARRRQQRGPA